MLKLIAIDNKNIKQENNKLIILLIDLLLKCFDRARLLKTKGSQNYDPLQHIFILFKTSSHKTLYYTSHMAILHINKHNINNIYYIVYSRDVILYIHIITHLYNTCIHHTYISVYIYIVHAYEAYLASAIGTCLMDDFLVIFCRESEFLLGTVPAVSWSIIVLKGFIVLLCVGVL